MNFGRCGGSQYEDCVFLRCCAMIVHIILRSPYNELHHELCHKFMHITYYFSDANRECSSVKSDVGSVTVVGTVVIGIILATRGSLLYERRPYSFSEAWTSYQVSL